MAVQTETTTAQTTSTAGATLRQLTGDLEAKRQIYVSFLTQAGQARLAAEQSPTAHILFQAVPPQLPAHSFGMISLVLGFFCGVTGAAGIAIMRNMMNSKINTTDEMLEVTGLPVFGSLPEIKQSRGRDILAVSPITETFRAMWITLRPQQRQGVAILVTSSETGEGKTTVALGLARRFASDGFRVLLIDCDLRHPSLATLLKRQPKPSIETMLNGVVQGTISTVEPGFDCLLADGSIENPVKVLSSDRFERLLADYRQVYDFVILDSPPVLHVADPLLLAKLCQHIIFLVQSGRVSNELVSEATQRFTEDDRAENAHPVDSCQTLSYGRARLLQWVRCAHCWSLMDTPVSLIIPVLNEEVYIERCLRSLLRQENCNIIEVLVVGGGSTDDTVALVREMSSVRREIRLIHNPKNEGQSAGINLLCAG